MTSCARAAPVPDAANPCKHTAAVYYILAERFDEDPFALFTLRGRTKEELVESLRARRTTSAGGGSRASSATRVQDAIRAEAAGDAEAALELLTPAYVHLAAAAERRALRA
jgi:uncharacterized Zn finger protein